MSSVALAREKSEESNFLTFGVKGVPSLFYCSGKFI